MGSTADLTGTKSSSGSQYCILSPMAQVATALHCLETGTTAGVCPIWRLEVKPSCYYTVPHRTKLSWKAPSTYSLLLLCSAPRKMGCHPKQSWPPCLHWSGILSLRECMPRPGRVAILYQDPMTWETEQCLDWVIYLRPNNCITILSYSWTSLLVSELLIDPPSEVDSSLCFSLAPRPGDRCTPSSQALCYHCTWHRSEILLGPTTPAHRVTTAWYLVTKCLSHHCMLLFWFPNCCFALFLGPNPSEQPYFLDQCYTLVSLDPWVHLPWHKSELCSLALWVICSQPCLREWICIPRQL
jgi:hypothetical protein